MSERGFGPEDVPAARRAVFDVAVEQASARVDPRDDFGGWVEVLWEELAELFGWQPGDWPIPPDDSMAADDR